MWFKIQLTRDRVSWLDWDDKLKIYLHGRKLTKEECIRLIVFAAHDLVRFFPLMNVLLTAKFRDRY